MSSREEAFLTHVPAENKLRFSVSSWCGKWGASGYERKMGDELAL